VKTKKVGKGKKKAAWSGWGKKKKNWKNVEMGHKHGRTWSRV